jgi:hypothetical protein
VGHTYDVSVKISSSDNSKYTSNNFGVKFSTTTNFAIDNTAHVNSTSIVTDKVNWITISGTFVADSNYSYVAIGNFFTDANTATSTSCPSCSFAQHCYFVDDVCVLESTIGFATGNCAVPFTPSWIPVVPQSSCEMTISPNPGAGDVILHFTSEKDVSAGFSIIDISGREIYHSNVLSGMENDWVIDTKGFAAGMYTVRMNVDDGIQLTQKLIVQ